LPSPRCPRSHSIDDFLILAPCSPPLPSHHARSSVWNHRQRLIDVHLIVAASRSHSSLPPSPLYQLRRVWYELALSLLPSRASLAAHRATYVHLVGGAPACRSPFSSPPLLVDPGLLLVCSWSLACWLHRRCLRPSEFSLTHIVVVDLPLISHLYSQSPNWLTLSP
jgi:hypothetical protein